MEILKPVQSQPLISGIIRIKFGIAARDFIEEKMTKYYLGVKNVFSEDEHFVFQQTGPVNHVVVKSLHLHL